MTKATGTQGSLTELRAALADEEKLTTLTAQAEAWLSASPSDRAAIITQVRKRRALGDLLHGLEAAQEFHERSAVMFRDVVRQIEASDLRSASHG